MNEFIVYQCAVHTQTLPLLRTSAKLQTVSTSFIMSVSQSVCLLVHPSVHPYTCLLGLSAWNNMGPTGPIFMKFDISVFF